MFYPLLHLYQNKSLSLQYHLRRTLAAVKLQQLLENGIFVFRNVISIFGSSHVDDIDMLVTFYGDSKL